MKNFSLLADRVLRRHPFSLAVSIALILCLVALYAIYLVAIATQGLNSASSTLAYLWGVAIVSVIHFWTDELDKRDIIPRGLYHLSCLAVLIGFGYGLVRASIIDFCIASAVLLVASGLYVRVKTTPKSKRV